MSKTEDFRNWDDYVDEAKVPPFRLKVAEGDVIEIECPTGVAIMRISQGLRSGDLELILRALTGDHWDRFEDLLGRAGHKVLPRMVEDMMDHFDLYEDVTLVSPDGGKRKARRPKEIQRLLDLGYRPAGEAHASRG